MTGGEANRAVMARVPLDSRSVAELASGSAGAPAGGTAGLSSHADAIHAVHTGATVFANWNDHIV
jgi:hypothetical protein